MLESPQENVLKYPVIVHHRVILVKDIADEAALRAAVASCDLTEALAPANTSREGKYITFGFSARVASREELYAIDARLRAVPGVRMVL